MNFSRFIYNFFANICSTGISVVLGLIAIPFLISVLGKEQYGLTVLFSSIFGIASTIESGFNSSIIRKLSLCVAEKNETLFNRVFSFSISWGFGLAAILSCLAFAFAPQFLSIFSKIPENLMAAAISAFGICILNSALTAFVLPITLALFSTKHRFDLIAIIRASIISVQVLAWYLVLSYTDYGLAGWAVSSLAVTCFFIIFALVLGKILTPNLRYVLMGWDGELFRELFWVGGKVSIMRLSAFANNYFNPILFSIYGNIVMNTIYQAAIKGTSVVGMIVGNVSEQMIPHVADMVVKNDMRRLSRVYIDVSRMIFTLIAGLAAVFLANAEHIFYLWLSGPLPDSWLLIANVFACLLLLEVIFIPSEVQWPLLLVINKLNPVFIFYLIRMVVTVTSVVLMLKYTSLGVYSVVLTNLPIKTATMLFFMRMIKPYVGMSIAKQISSIFTRGTLCSIFLLGVFFAIKFSMPQNFSALSKLLVGVIADVLILVPSLWFFGLSKEDKQRLLKLPIISKIKNFASSAFKWRMH